MLQLLMHTKGCREVILYWNPGRCLIINQPVTSKENFINIDFYFILNFQFNVLNWRFQQTKIMHNMFLWKTYSTIVSSILIFTTYNLKRGIIYGKFVSIQDFEKYTITLRYQVHNPFQKRLWFLAISNLRCYMNLFSK